jgi:hypothetical protein
VDQWQEEAGHQLGLDLWVVELEDKLIKVIACLRLTAQIMTYSFMTSARAKGKDIPATEGRSIGKNWGNSLLTSAAS